MPNQRLVKVPEAATYSDYSEATIWRLLRIGAITRYRVGANGARVDLDELDAFLAPVAIRAHEAGSK